MAVVITGNNTPTAGGVTYGDGTTYANTAAGTAGQVLTSAGSSAPVWAAPAGFTFGTVVTPTSGLEVTFSGIPATAKVIKVIFSGLSTNVGGSYYVRLGDSGGIETTGYQSASSAILLSTVDSAQSTTGFALNTSFPATSTTSGIMELINITGNTWVASGTFGSYISGFTTYRTSNVGGTKTLSDVLDRILVGAGDTFDAGSINIAYL